MYSIHKALLIPLIINFGFTDQRKLKKISRRGSGWNDFDMVRAIFSGIAHRYSGLNDFDMVRATFCDIPYRDMGLNYSQCNSGGA